MADYERLLVEQKGVCAICGRTNPDGRGLAYDHNHASGEPRGLLCDRCNRGLGYFAEDSDRLIAAREYLIAWA
jgi:hypothetical protein